MSDLIEPLGTFAEFSIGIAGFAGIIAAFTSASEGAELRLFRFRNLLITAFAPGFLSILTICLVYSGVMQETAVKISSAVLLSYLCAWAILVVRTMPAGSTVRILTYFMWGISLANMGLQVLSLATSTYSVSFYFFGLLLLLLQAAVVFASLALGTLMGDG
jgi:hypothetical protein